MTFLFCLPCGSDLTVGEKLLFHKLLQMSSVKPNVVRSVLVGPVFSTALTLPLPPPPTAPSTHLPPPPTWASTLFTVFGCVDM